jgi:cytidylate kinase
MQNIIIAIDGFSACGKSTTAKLVAEKLGFTYIDTGAMYRAVTLYFLQHYVSLDNPKEISKALSNIHLSFQKTASSTNADMFLNGLNVEDEIRKMYISDQVSQVSALKDVRVAMVDQQQRMGKKKAIVMDGRDIGTYVFPQAELKIFMSADMEIRAGRRQQELLEKGQMVPLTDVIENIRKRDEIDTTRKESPLVQASDAVLVDTSHLTIEEQVDIVLHYATEVITAKMKG